MQLTVPDSLTTWVASAFVVSEDLGLGFAEAPVEVLIQMSVHSTPSPAEMLPLGCSAAHSLQGFVPVLESSRLRDPRRGAAAGGRPLQLPSTPGGGQSTAPHLHRSLQAEPPASRVIRLDFHCFCCQVTVIVAESDMFQFVFLGQGGSSTPFVNYVFVESQGEASVHVPIRPLVLGEVPISVKAMTSSASHSVLRTVVVKVHVQDVKRTFTI